MKGAPRARRRVPSFDGVLAEVENEDRDPDRVTRPLAYPFAAVDPPSETAAGQATAAWDQAFAWLEAVAEPVKAAPAPAPAAPFSDHPEVVAAELQLSEMTTLAEISAARRRFMWANHPDRRPDAPRDLANRRVAIANMLFDRAEAALAARRGRR